MRALLHRIARRCPTHDTSSPRLIRELEGELGMEASPSSGSFVEDHANPNLIDCGLRWCKRGR
jgi:hypothetical protein